MSSVSIYLCCLVPEEEESVRDALREMAERLRSRHPKLPSVELHDSSEHDRHHLPSYIMQQLPGQHLASTERVRLDGDPVFVFCNQDAPYAVAAREANAAALWGAAQLGSYALVWTLDNKYLWWHEAMHLLYAHDCYDSTGQTTCGESRCLMQYAPTERNCEGELYLCESTQRWIAINA